MFCTEFRNVTRRVALTGAMLAIAPGLAWAATETVIHTFQGKRDGQNPSSGLIRIGGKLYGTTSQGGSGNGTVFWVTPDGRKKVVHAFTGGTDGIHPSGGLTDVGGTICGVTIFGGGASGCPGSGCGTVYAIAPDGSYSVLYRFQGSLDGAFPMSNLVELGGQLYGTTNSSGANGLGTVFAITPQGVETVLHSFLGGADGARPDAGVSTDGTKVYGLTARGGGTGCGGSGCGTIFSVSPSGTASTFYAFKNSSLGQYPNGPLLKVGTAFYGTTSNGGAHHFGTVFRLSAAGKLKVLHSFAKTDGGFPFAGLANVKGTLYGTTASGGSANLGTVFSITTTGTFTSVYDVPNTAGGHAVDNSLLDVNGILYGTAVFGGSCPASTSGCGTVFSFTP